MYGTQNVIEATNYLQTDALLLTNRDNRLEFTNENIYTPTSNVFNYSNNVFLGGLQATSIGYTSGNNRYARIITAGVSTINLNNTKFYVEQILNVI